MSDAKRLETLLNDLQGRIDATKLAVIQDTIDRIEELEAKLAKVTSERDQALTMNIHHRPLLGVDKVIKHYSEKDGVPMKGDQSDG